MSAKAKIPHTASFLLRFHTSGAGFAADLADDTAALASEAAQDDLLDLIPENHVADLRSERQTAFMLDLIDQVTNLDYQLGRQAREYTEGMTERGRWTPGRDGNASAWIDRLITKVKELKAAQPVAPKPTALPAVADGRYAVTHDGELKFFHVENGTKGKWAGFIFLDRRSSDDLSAIKNPKYKGEVLALIAADPEAAAITYALKLNQCRHCHRTLTDYVNNPYLSQGYGPKCGANL